DFQDSPDDEEDTKNSHEYLNDLEEENQAKSLLAKSKRFFKKGTQRFSSAKATDQTECHKCGKKGHFARDCWSKTSVPSYQSPFQLKLLHSSENKPEPRQTKDFEAKYIKDEEEVSSDDNEVTEVKALMALTGEERVLVSKESARNGDWTKISMKKVSITDSDKPRLSEAEDSTLSNHSVESQRIITDPLVVVTDSLATDYDSAGESSVCSTPLPPLKKLDGVEPISGPKTIKSILKSKSTFKAKTLKGIIINEPSLAPAKGNKISSASKTNLAPAGKLKNVKMEDDPLLAIVMKELNELILQISNNKSSYFRNKNTQHVPLNALQNKYKTQFILNCELCGENNHLSKNCYQVLFCKKCKRTNHRTCDHAEFMSSMNINQYHTGQVESFLRSRPSKPAIPFPSCIHYRYNNHKYDDYVYYPICEICGSYDHDTHGHNKIISLRRGIKPRNPQHVIKNYETCGSNVHTTSDHNEIEWFRKREALQL
ncbi:retrovirus-related pol polyprotein from transposon TNT 1-94, partial [Tanacetum coccineum]